MSKYHQKNTIHVQHITIGVSNIKNSSFYYQKLLNFDIIEITNSTAKLGKNHQEILTLKQVEPKQKGLKAGLYHMAFLLPSEAHLGSWLKHQISLGTRFIGASDHGVSQALYLSDPDGNGIEVYADRDAAMWQWHQGSVEMVTEALDIAHLINQAYLSFEEATEELILGHVHLATKHLHETERFYQALGFAKVLDFGSAQFLSDHAYHHHLGLNEWNMRYAKDYVQDDTNVISMDLIYPNQDRLNQALSAIRALGYTYHQNENITLIDPIGIPLYLLVS